MVYLSSQARLVVGKMYQVSHVLHFNDRTKSVDNYEIGHREYHTSSDICWRSYLDSCMVDYYASFCCGLYHFVGSDSAGLCHFIANDTTGLYHLIASDSVGRYPFISGQSRFIVGFTAIHDLSKSIEYVGIHKAAFTAIQILHSKSVAFAAKHLLVFSHSSFPLTFQLIIPNRALQIDRLVGRLNLRIHTADPENDWPEPYWIAKAIRRNIRRTIRRISAFIMWYRHQAQMVISFFESGFLILLKALGHINRKSRKPRIPDNTELGNVVSAEEPPRSVPKPKSQTEEAKESYHISLRNTFREDKFAEEILGEIMKWENRE